MQENVKHASSTHQACIKHASSIHQACIKHTESTQQARRSKNTARIQQALTKHAASTQLAPRFPRFMSLARPAVYPAVAEFFILRFENAVEGSTGRVSYWTLPVKLQTSNNRQLKSTLIPLTFTLCPPSSWITRDASQSDGKVFGALGNRAPVSNTELLTTTTPAKINL